MLPLYYNLKVQTRQLPEVGYTAMDHNFRGASTGGRRPGTASGPHHRCPRGATPNPNIGVDCAWLRAEPLLG